MTDLIRDSGLDVHNNYTVDWLRNPDTGYNMYIDIFIPALNLAIEYDGKQHFRPTLKGQTKDAISKYQARDRAKDELCSINSVRMVRFSYRENLTHDLFKEKTGLMV